jgi:hypothetical protein
MNPDDIPTGGPAFPIHWENHNEGMTLRDYFAAKALHYALKNSFSFDGAAKEAYEIADAMLQARSA